MLQVVGDEVLVLHCLVELDLLGGAGPGAALTLACFFDCSGVLIESTEIEVSQLARPRLHRDHSLEAVFAPLVAIKFDLAMAGRDPVAWL